MKHCWSWADENTAKHKTSLWTDIACKEVKDLGVIIDHKLTFKNIAKKLGEKPLQQGQNFISPWERRIAWVGVMNWHWFDPSISTFWRTRRLHGAPSEDEQRKSLMARKYHTKCAVNAPWYVRKMVIFRDVKETRVTKDKGKESVL